MERRLRRKARLIEKRKEKENYKCYIFTYFVLKFDLVFFFFLNKNNFKILFIKKK